MELSEKDIKLVKKSIEHWKDDIQTEFLKGLTISKNSDNHPVWSNKILVNCYSDSCPLCKEYSDNYCLNCPYNIKYKLPCFLIPGHWKAFVNNPTLETCNTMIKALEDILEED